MLLAFSLRVLGCSLIFQFRIIVDRVRDIATCVSSKKKNGCCGRIFGTKEELSTHRKIITRKVVVTSLTKRTSNQTSLLIVILPLLFLSLCSIVVAGAPTNGYTDVTVSQAKTMIDCDSSLVVLDVRNQSEYDSGHIRNAKLIPVHELESRLDELDLNCEILVYCRSGGRSRMASEILANNSFLCVYNMLGGLIAWTDEGHSVYVKYSSIQEAINNASEGHKIFVASETYSGHIVVNKTVSLVGENRDTTLLDGNGTQTVLKLVKPNINVTSFTIRNGTEGIHLTVDADSCLIADCKISNNSLGIFLGSDNNKLTGNIISSNEGSGIKIYASCPCAPVQGTIITANNLLNNGYAVQLTNSVEGQIYHNNLTNNTYQVSCLSGNTWDDDYPSGGNYWSDYNDMDLYNGPAQSETGGDGIGDIPYTIFESIADRYPLMTPIHFFDAGTWNDTLIKVHVVSNSKVLSIQLNETEKTIKCQVMGETDLGFCRITVPNAIVQDLWENNYTVLVDGEPPLDMRNWTDTTSTHIYFTYEHSEHEIIIIPELQSTAVLLLLMFFITLAVITLKKKLP